MLIKVEYKRPQINNIKLQMETDKCSNYFCDMTEIFLSAWSMHKCIPIFAHLVITPYRLSLYIK